MLRSPNEDPRERIKKAIETAKESGDTERVSFLQDKLKSLKNDKKKKR